MKQGGPPPKAKYSQVPDRGAVPSRKGEKHPARGGKEDLKQYVYKKWEREECDRVLFVERAGELLWHARLWASMVWSRRETES